MNMNMSEKLSIDTFINTPACYHPRGVNECRFVRAAGVVFLDVIWHALIHKVMVLALRMHHLK